MSTPYVGFSRILVKALADYSFTWCTTFLDFVYNFLSVFFPASHYYYFFCFFLHHINFLGHLSLLECKYTFIRMEGGSRN